MIRDEQVVNASFHASALVRRQYSVFDSECGCTKAMHAMYRRQYTASNQATLLIDGTGFRWEGLGNSGTRWMGLLRWGFATGRSPYLRIGRDCTSRISGPCRLDIGQYFVGYNHVDWHWNSQASRIKQYHADRGQRPLTLRYSCHRRRAGAPGCDIARLKMKNGTILVLAEPQELLEWFRTVNEPFIRIVLAQQDSLEASYSRPESLRTRHGPLTRCPITTAPSFRTRELALKCTRIPQAEAACIAQLLSCPSTRVDK